jgi:formylglycine-generating enzyme required for sulfatase activity
MKKLEKILTLLFILSSVFAQTITNVQARQEGLEIIITYDMAGQLQSGDEIKVGYSTDGGRNYKPISGAEGDVGKNVKPGTGRYISFIANDALAGKNAKFKVGTISEFTPPGMVFVAGGTFQMGSNSGIDDEKPVHTVTVSSFFMDKTEVTQAEYRKVMGKNPSSFSGCDACPVEQVRWYDANEYAKKVGKRLPTEAEWEYAARGGNKSKGYTYSGGYGLDAVGWYTIQQYSSYNSGSKTHPVAQKQPNELGLYDMSGNVWEWCSDWHGYYSSSPQTDPQGSNSGARRVLRGGSWSSFDSHGRVANRYGYNPDGRFNNYGFRLVLLQDSVAPYPPIPR